MSTRSCPPGAALGHFVRYLRRLPTWRTLATGGTVVAIIVAAAAVAAPSSAVASPTPGR